MAVVHKNGDIRICINPRELNKALVKTAHPVPMIELLPEISNAKIFSKGDVHGGFLARAAQRNRKLSHNLLNAIWLIPLAENASNNS